MSAAQAIDALKHAYHGQVILPDTEAYELLNNSYLSARESDLNPSAIYQPKTKNDVAAFLKIVKQSNTNFAIRGAGQQPLDACANISDGITLDLSLLTGIEVKDSIVSIAAGEHWGAVYDVLDSRGLAVGGSRSSKGGIGGLALAGGLSFFSSREGFISDSVVSYEVVLSSGSIVQANERENSDLWRALRGGGNNFGVVTRFDLRTYPQKPFWGGMVFYLASNANFPGQVKNLVDEIRKPNSSEETHLMVNMGFFAQFGDATIGLNQVYYTGADAESFGDGTDRPIPPLLEPFVTVQPQIEQLKQVGVTTLAASAAAQGAMAQAQTRASYVNMTVKADVATLISASQIYATTVELLKALEGIVLSFTLQPYPKSLLQKTAGLGDNVLGLSAEEPLVSILLLTYWKNAGDDEKVLALLQTAMEAIDKDAESRGQKVPFVSLNYAAKFQDPIGSYGAENKKFLQEVSIKYDPEQIFQRNLPGGFKLFA